jgi:hypothetical protein
MTYHATVLAPHPDHGMTGASRNVVPNTSADTEAGARSLAAVYALGMWPNDETRRKVFLSRVEIRESRA